MKTLNVITAVIIISIVKLSYAAPLYVTVGPSVVYTFGKHEPGIASNFGYGLEVSVWYFAGDPNENPMKTQ